MLCGHGTVRIKPKKHDPDHVTHVAPTRKHELDQTDHDFSSPDSSSRCGGKRLSVGCVEARQNMGGMLGPLKYSHQRGEGASTEQIPNIPLASKCQLCVPGFFDSRVAHVMFSQVGV